MRFEGSKVVVKGIFEKSAQDGVATDGAEVVERDVAHEAVVVRRSVADEASVDVKGWKGPKTLCNSLF